MSHPIPPVALIAALILSGCPAAGPIRATDPPCLGASPCPSPTPPPASDSAAAPPTTAGEISNWDGVIKRNDQRQAGVTLRLAETVNANRVRVLQGSWTLRGDFNETATLSGYRSGEVWTMSGTLNGLPFHFEATLTNNRLQGPYADLRSRQTLGTLDLLKR